MRPLFTPGASSRTAPVVRPWTLLGANHRGIIFWGDRLGGVWLGEAFNILQPPVALRLHPDLRILAPKVPSSPGLLWTEEPSASDEVEEARWRGPLPADTLDPLH